LEALHLIGTRELTEARAWLAAGLERMRARSGAGDIIAKEATTLRTDRSRCPECALAEACRVDRDVWSVPPDDAR
jgi:hypothetical protein